MSYMTEIYEYVMIYMNDRNIWMYYDYMNDRQDEYMWYVLHDRQDEYMWYGLHDRQDEQIWYEIHDWKEKDRYDMNYMIENRWTDMKWCTWMIEIYGYVMIYMDYITDRYE